MLRFLFYRLFYVRGGWLFSAYYFWSKLAKPFKRSLVCFHVVNNPKCVSLDVHVLQLHDDIHNSGIEANWIIQNFCCFLTNSSSFSWYAASIGYSPGAILLFFLSARGDSSLLFCLLSCGRLGTRQFYSSIRSRDVSFPWPMKRTSRTFFSSRHVGLRNWELSTLCKGRNKGKETLKFFV